MTEPPPYSAVRLLNCGIEISLAFSSPHSPVAIGKVQTNVGLIRKEHGLPFLLIPSEMLLVPFTMHCSRRANSSSLVVPREWHADGWPSGSHSHIVKAIPDGLVRNMHTGGPLELILELPGIAASVPGCRYG
jgi:hypothetical protein